MTTLQTAISNLTYLTDKSTTHSYVDVYQSIFKDIKDDVKNILEIGINSGGSLLLWKKYFAGATVYGCDINARPIRLHNYDDIITFQSNAYDETFIKTNFIEKGIKFDIIIDDGPHTLDSMLFFAQNYPQLLTETGIIIIEDIQSMDWIEQIIQSFPSELRSYVYVEDRRHIKNRYDDILIILDKRKF